MQGILSDNASDSSDSLIVQLGDVGSGQISGSAEAFDMAKEYLQGFNSQFTTILGENLKALVVPNSQKRWPKQLSQ